MWPEGYENNPLYTFLREHGDGIIILRSYQQKGYLTNKIRNLLTRLIVYGETNVAFEKVKVYGEPHQNHLDKFIITPDRFKELACRVHSLFPGENIDTYYMPYRSVNKTKISASGKLYDHYQYTKTRLRRNGLLAKNCNCKNQPPTQSVQLTSDDVKKNSKRPEKEHIGPEDALQKKWKGDPNVKKEIKEEVKGEIKKEIKKEVKEEVKEEIKEEIKEEVKEEIKEEVKEEIKEEIKG